MYAQENGLSSNGAISLAYLVSEYPAVSHTFILREVRRLRQLGFKIYTAAINAPDRQPERMTQEEREEASATYYVKRSNPIAVLSAHARAFARSPHSYLHGLGYALWLGGLNLGHLMYSVFYFVEAVLVGEWMRANRVGHLHVHFATPAATVGLLASRIYGTGSSITVHGPDEFFDAPGYRLVEKIAGANFICCIGMFARSQLMKLSSPDQWSKFEISPLGVFPDAFAPRSDPDHADHFEILCVGRLVPAKGQHILVAAVHRLITEGRRVLLRFVGDGPDRTSLEAEVSRRRIRDAVIFEGSVNQERIRSFYSTADVFALASFAEGIPVVLMEAMAMEVPAVSTYIAGIPELIRSGIDGVLVYPSDEIGLAKALADLMDDPEERRRLGRAGRQRVLERYDLDHNILGLAEIFRRRVSRHA